MKKELQMTIKKDGSLNEFICRLIGKNNQGDVSYTLQEVAAILKGRKVITPYALEKLNIMHLGHEIIISEDGENVSVIIEERELMVLNESISDYNYNDLSNEFQEWCNKNNFPHISADELLTEESISKTQEQKNYLKDFLNKWDKAS